MAWQTITHTCGHDSREQMYGKHSERERRADYLGSRPCRECWIKEQQTREASNPTPITMTIGCNGLDRIGGELAIEIRLDGGTYARKEEIKAMGYRWTEARGSIMGNLLATKEHKAWIRVLPVSKCVQYGLQHELGADLAPFVREEAKTLGAQIVNGIRALEAAMIQNQQANG